ncbi:MAG: hypothetical protein ACREDR_37500, partial [Blastocatellia bacterium]
MSLKIRPEQVDAFQEVADAAFVRRVVEHLRERHPSAIVRISSGTVKVEQIQDDVIRKMVESGVARARGYGMTWESSIASFVVLMFLTAPNFDKHPLIERVLKDEQVDT